MQCAPRMLKKYENLKTILASHKRLVVAFSGGVDSSFLLKVAHDVLGENVLGVSVQTPYIAHGEIDDARRVAAQIGVSHVVHDAPWIESLKHNPENRCYVCKHALFSSLQSLANQKGFFAIAEGSNVDDTHELRPGRQALQELGIVTPLLEAQLHKEEIRALSKHLGLSTWDKPSYACLLTRFSHNVSIETHALAMVENAEAYLIAKGYAKMRVRYEQRMARIEMEKEDALRLMNDAHFSCMIAHLKAFGFLHVMLDLEGYRYESQRKGI
ncbi:ATP-dependent sacrificial sulfur transferase LarE [Sulfurospirillum barnesii]|uniref:TIGR00268 family protein n=1 Tax=Sulfurospirillum barnesii (strain ATCC 700032 / DSM 10660 / SES-3) TaxID=760154 RepID=I3XXE4_SULBS|nr:ATP-dependent sacrificial sulfur transferase LarE [Sulfurospirillum barnesii]AFL68618.1 TIGR00268 family protein [Sulfurospirillum barnesii SES-3]